MIYDNWDIHMHTTNSDGKYSITEIRNKVYTSNWNKVASITDHQYMTDKKAFKENNILWIPGIEISAVANWIPVHITWYGVEPKFSDTLKNIIKTIVDWYNIRAQKIYDRWLSLWYKPAPLNTLRDSNLPAPIYKSDMVKELWKIAGIENEKDVRKRARKTGNLFFVEEKNFMPDVSGLIPAMHESNMIACRAHPWKKLFRNPEEMKSWWELLDYIVSSWIDWIEVFSHTHTVDQSFFFIKEAKKRSLLITGWSDYHGEEWHDIDYLLDSEYLYNFLKAIDYHE